MDISIRFKTTSMSGALLLGLIIVSTSSAAGQSAPFDTGPNSWTPPGSPVNIFPPSPTNSVNMGFPGVNVYQASPAWQSPSQSWNYTSASTWTPPDPTSRPTREQTQWYVNNNPYLSSLDSVTKSNLVN